MVGKPLHSPESLASESLSLRRQTMSAKSRSFNRRAKRLLVAVIVLGSASLVGVLAITPRSAELDSPSHALAGEASMRRSVDAYAARYTGLAEYYDAAKNALERGREAYAARLTGQAEQALTKGHSSALGMEAYAARCAGIAEHYAATTQ